VCVCVCMLGSWSHCFSYPVVSQGTVGFVSNASLHFLGYDPSEMLGYQNETFIAREDLVRSLAVASVVGFC
jgi:hypothetical protein